MVLKSSTGGQEYTNYKWLLELSLIPINDGLCVLLLSCSILSASGLHYIQVYQTHSIESSRGKQLSKDEGKGREMK